MSTDPYVAQHEGLCFVHRSLVEAFTAALTVPDAHRAAAFLHAHHTVESEILFPGLRRAGRLRSTDVAFLESCDREHHELHALVERMLGSTDRSEVIHLAGETLGRLVVHTADEEAGLAPDRLRTMIDEDGLAAIGRAAEELRSRF